MSTDFDKLSRAYHGPSLAEALEVALEHIAAQPGMNLTLRREVDGFTRLDSLLRAALARERALGPEANAALDTMFARQIGALRQVLQLGELGIERATADMPPAFVAYASSSLARARLWLARMENQAGYCNRPAEM